MSDTKSPAFRLYAADFIMGTAAMNCTQVGAYTRLLCYQWDHGSVPSQAKEAAKLSGCSTGIAGALLKAKFPFSEDGKRRNKRLERERAKQVEFSRVQSEKGRKGSEKRWKQDSRGHSPAIAGEMPVPSLGHNQNIASVFVSGVLEHEREQPPFPEAETPGENEVKFYAQTIGLAEWKALDWLDEMKGAGWLDFNRRQIVDWRAVMRRVKTKWEADGRPSTPPVRNVPGERPRGKSIMEQDAASLRKELEKI